MKDHGRVLCNFENIRINRMYSDRQAGANRVDQDETPQNAAFLQGLHLSPLIQQF